MAIHESAAVGYERRSETYASARPSYHPHVLDRVVAAVGAGRIVDFGAGTGISTAALIDRGLDVLAVEPVEAMRVTLAATVPNAAVATGTAESIPADDNSVAAVVVAQAFHWFDHSPALDEIARVLQPEGCLVTLWNVRDETVPWMAAYTRIQDRLQGYTPRYRDMAWRHSIEADPRFGLVDEVRVANPQPSNADHTVARFLSTSFVASRDAQQQNALEAEIRELVAPLGETYDFPYWTEAQIWELPS